MSLILEVRRQRQVDHCEFKASLVYTSSSRTARVIQRISVLKEKRERKKERKKGRKKEKGVGDVILPTPCKIQGAGYCLGI